MKTIGVGAAVFDDEERLLLVKQSYAARLWALPGGGIEDGESPVDAAAREVLEETGLEVEIGDLIGVYWNSRKDGLWICFMGKISGGTLRPLPGEIEETEFFGKDDVPEHVSEATHKRIEDAFDGVRGAFRVIS